MKTLVLVVLLTSLFSCERKDTKEINLNKLQLIRVMAGSVIIDISGDSDNVPTNKEISIEFNVPLNTSTVYNSIRLKDENSEDIIFDLNYTNQNKTVLISPVSGLNYDTKYSIVITDNLIGANGSNFDGLILNFKTESGILTIENISINGLYFEESTSHQNIDPENVTIQVTFSDSLNDQNYWSYFTLSGSKTLNTELSSDKKTVTAIPTEILTGYTKYFFNISGNLTSVNGYKFEGFTGSFFTSLDSSYKFPIVTDEELLTIIQKQTFKYFWDFAHPVSGAIRERNTSNDIVTSGGTGFGIMAIIVGIERNFITREEGITRFSTILNFLETCDRFHGAYSHWINGVTGETVPFSAKDDGADLVETAYVIQGLFTFRQYLNTDDLIESALIPRINNIINDVEYDWFTQGQDVLYWHWSPNYSWDMNLQIRGYNETIITYILAASSTTHSIDKDVYDNGWAGNGSIINGKQFYDITLPLGYDYGGPMFYSHYSYLGLDPRNLSDAYGNYWKQSVAHAKINHAYCAANPNNYVGYSSDCWGLTASDNQTGYSAHSPTNDLGVITPTAAVASIPYTPEESMDAIHLFYYLLGDKLWGEYGFYDAFNVTENWWANSYIAIDQGPIIIMIENYRTGLLWDLFMSSPEVQAGLNKLGFSYE